jgi:hypothetical protein
MNTLGPDDHTGDTRLRDNDPVIETTFTASVGEPLRGRFQYSVPDWTFAFEADPAALAERVGSSGVASMSLATLQIEVDVESGLVLNVWGYHPNVYWLNGSVPLADVPEGRVHVRADPERLRAGDVVIAEIGEWTTVQDPRTGWIVVTADAEQPDDEQVLIATGTALGLRAGKLNSLWLHPAMVAAFSI